MKGRVACFSPWLGKLGSLVVPRITPHDPSQLTPRGARAHVWCILRISELEKELKDKHDKEIADLENKLAGLKTASEGDDGNAEAEAQAEAEATKEAPLPPHSPQVSALADHSKNQRGKGGKEEEEEETNKQTNKRSHFTLNLAGCIGRPRAPTR